MTSSTKIFLKITILFGLILSLAYIFRVEEHLPVMVRSTYQSLIYLMTIAMLVGIIITIAFTLIDMSEIGVREI